MYATVRRTKLKAGKLNDFVQFWHDQSRPILQTWPGVTHSYLLTDPTTDSVISVTLWESEKAAKADPPAAVAASYQAANSDIRSLVLADGKVDYCQVSGTLSS